MKLLGYLLSPDGSVSTKVFTEDQVEDNEITLKDLDSAYGSNQSDKCYILEEHDYLMYLHPDNKDLSSTSTLPINLALRKYWPDSPFVGSILIIYDATVVHIDKITKEIISPPWTLEEFTKDYHYRKTDNSNQYELYWIHEFTDSDED